MGGIFGLVSILLLTFYMLVESESIFDLFVRLFPRGRRQNVSRVSGLAAEKISAWLGGQMLLGLIIGTTTAIGYFLMGVPYFFVLAVIAGIGEMIPMVGPLLSAIPAVLVALTVSPGLALGVAGYCLAPAVDREQFPRAEGDGSNGRPERGDGDPVARDRQRTARLRRRAARRADRGNHPGVGRRAVSRRERSGVTRLSASGAGVALLYSVSRVIMTWPLVLGLGSDVPGDLGDSLLNMWILGWGAEHVPRLLTGSIGWSEFWNANIFHPDPLALALSEHLFGQVLQILPVYWLTGNIILCYNLLFISTFALSAFGTYLLVRDLTGDKRAAFIAGLVYGFLPYRIASVPHLQVMSSQWMPFALYGLNRFVDHRIDSGARRRHGIAGDAELELRLLPALLRAVRAAVRRPSHVDVGHPDAPSHLDRLIAAAAGTLALTLPFLFPYQARATAIWNRAPVRRSRPVLRKRLVLHHRLRELEAVGKALRFYPHGEGETFLGFVPWLLAAWPLAGLVESGIQKQMPPCSPSSVAERTCRRFCCWPWSPN